MKVIHPYDPEGLEIKRKIWSVLAIIMLLLSVAIVRLIYLQVIKYSRYKRLSERNRIRFEVLYPPRGHIYDRYGNIIAKNRASFDIYVIPEEMGTQDKEVIKRLSEILGLDFKSTYDKYKGWLSKHRRFEAFRIGEDVKGDTLIKAEVYSPFLPGVHISLRPVRDYINSASVAHLLGYLGEISEDEFKRLKREGYRRGDVIGKVGIEYILEKYLKGKKGWEEVEVDAIGRKVEELRKKEPFKGEDVFLSIDFELQQYSYKLMKDKRGVVLAMDPETGEILVFVSMPSYDPSDFVRGIKSTLWQRYVSDEGSPLYNRVVYGLYPPGSTFKPFVAIAGLEEGVINPNEKIRCYGRLKIGRKWFRCWKKVGHGQTNLMKAISESCDVYFYALALKLGPERLMKYVRKFGFGVKTGIIFKDEKQGLLLFPGSSNVFLSEPWTDGKTAILGIGQGYVLVTPLQLIRAYSAIVNGGYLLKPRFVLKVGEYEDFDEEERYQVEVSRETLDFIKHALKEVVENPKGTAHHIRSKTLTIGGKTGTSQVVKKEVYEGLPEDEIPYEWRDHAIFVGFAPVDKPEIVVLVILEHGGYGWRAASVAKKIIDKFFEERRS